MGLKLIPGEEERSRCQKRRERGRINLIFGPTESWLRNTHSRFILSAQEHVASAYRMFLYKLLTRISFSCLDNCKTLDMSHWNKLSMIAPPVVLMISVYPFRNQSLPVWVHNCQLYHVFWMFSFTLMTLKPLPQEHKYWYYYSNEEEYHCDAQLVEYERFVVPHFWLWDGMGMGQRVSP